MGILGWIVFGLIVGAIAKLLMGGFIGRALGMYTANESAGFIMALLGAVVVLAIYRMTLGGRHRTV